MTDYSPFLPESVTFSATSSITLIVSHHVTCQLSKSDFPNQLSLLFLYTYTHTCARTHTHTDLLQFWSGWALTRGQHLWRSWLGSWSNKLCPGSSLQPDGSVGHHWWPPWPSHLLACSYPECSTECNLLNLTDKILWQRNIFTRVTKLKAVHMQYCKWIGKTWFHCLNPKPHLWVFRWLPLGVAS